MTEITEDIKEDEMAFAEKIKEEIRRIDDVEKSLRRLAGNEIVCNAEYNRRNVSDCLELADSLRLLLVSYDESFALTEEKNRRLFEGNKTRCRTRVLYRIPYFLYCGRW